MLPLTLLALASIFCGDGVLFSFSFFTGTGSKGVPSSSDESQICIRRDRAGTFSILDFLLAGEFASSLESKDFF